MSEENKALDKCPGHGREECVTCCWPPMQKTYDNIISGLPDSELNKLIEFMQDDDTEIRVLSHVPNAEEIERTKKYGFITGLVREIRSSTPGQLTMLPPNSEWSRPMGCSQPPAPVNVWLPNYRDEKYWRKGFPQKEFQIPKYLVDCAIAIEEAGGACLGCVDGEDKKS